MEEEDESIDKTFIVTQMINPSYFHLFNPYLRDDNARNILENSLTNEIQNFGASKELKKGDVVAFFLEDKKRFIRCEIDDIKKFNYSNYYFLFALDYGVSLFTTRPQSIHQVSEIVKFSKSPIMNKVALNVLPCITRYDYVNEKEEIHFHHMWSPLALEIFRQSLDKASVITFEMSDNVSSYKSFLFGDLILTTYYGVQFSMSDALIQAKVAKRASSPLEFEKHFNILMSRNIARWDDNSKTGGILKYEEGKLPLFYEDEIQIKKFLTNCEAVQSRKLSIQKVIEWQHKNDQYDRIQQNDESDETDDEWNILPVNNHRHNNQIIANNDEFYQKPKPKCELKLSAKHSMFGTKNVKCDTVDESIVSGISQSASQNVNHNN